MIKEEKDLFKTLSLTIRKWHVSTQSESETSTKRSIRRFNNKESLFNMLTESSNTAMMNFFQQEQDENLRLQKSSRSQESQDLRSKLFSSEMISQQWFGFKIMKMKLKMMKLKIQKLTNQKKLTEKNILFQFLTSNEFSASVYQWDKINIFHRYIAFKVLKLIFKLKDQNNYNN